MMLEVVLFYIQSVSIWSKSEKYLNNVTPGVNSKSKLSKHLAFKKFLPQNLGPRILRLIFLGQNSSSYTKTVLQSMLTVNNNYDLWLKLVYEQGTFFGSLRLPYVRHFFARTIFVQNGKCSPFLQLTPTPWQMPRDVTNISEDWADFCQCQEFWCHFLSFVFS